MMKSVVTGEKQDETLQLITIQYNGKSRIQKPHGAGMVGCGYEPVFGRATLLIRHITFVCNVGTIDDPFTENLVL